jgi:hypothetical protein
LKLTKEIEQGQADLSIEIEKIQTDLTKRDTSKPYSTLRWMIGLFRADRVNTGRAYHSVVAACYK